MIMNEEALGFVNRVEATNVDWPGLSNVDVGEVDTVQNGWCKDDERCHFRVGGDPLAQVYRVSVMERVVSALRLSGVSKHQRPPKVIGPYADTKLRFAKSPVGITGQADAVSDAGQHSGSRKIVVDDHRHAGKARLPSNGKKRGSIPPLKLSRWEKNCSTRVGTTPH